MSDVQKSWVDEPKRLAFTVKSLGRELAATDNLDKCLLRLYYQRPVLSSGSDPLRPYAELSTFQTLEQLGFNITREVVDASSAQICRPLTAKVEPTEASFEIRQACETLSKLIAGVLDVNEFWSDYGPRWWQDAATCRVGWLKVYVDSNSEIKLRRVDPLNVRYHTDEGANPAHLYTDEAVPRHSLMAEHPKHARQIEKLPAYRPPTIVGVEPPGSRGSDCVRVSEGWRVKMGKRTGKHVMMAGEDLLLVNEEFDSELHELVPMIWAPDFRGLGGVSLARILAPYHIWINKLIRQLAESLAGAVPHMIYEENSLTPDQNWSDLPFAKLAYSGPNKPAIEVPQTVSQAVVDQIDRIRERAFAEGGVNPQAAQGTRPAGLNSAPAQREWIDIVSIRASGQQRQWERGVRQLARVIVQKAASAYAKKGLRVRAPGTELLEEIRWDGMLSKLKENQYRVSFSLSSGLSTTVSGKMEQLQLLKTLVPSVVDETEVARNLDLTDIQKISQRVNAPRDLADRQISQALNHGIFLMPSPLQGEEGLNAIITNGAREYQRALLQVQMNPEAYPPANLEALRRLILAAKARLPGNQPQTVQPGALPVDPLAAAAPGLAAPAPGLAPPNPAAPIDPTITAPAVAAPIPTPAPAPMVGGMGA